MVMAINLGLYSIKPGNSEERMDHLCGDEERDAVVQKPYQSLTSLRNSGMSCRWRYWTGRLAG
jgi:hypothetical protein